MCAIFHFNIFAKLNCWKTIFQLSIQHSFVHWIWRMQTFPENNVGIGTRYLFGSSFSKIRINNVCARHVPFSMSRVRCSYIFKPSQEKKQHRWKPNSDWTIPTQSPSVRTIFFFVYEKRLQIFKSLLLVSRLHNQIEIDSNEKREKNTRKFSDWKGSTFHNQMRWVRKNIFHDWCKRSSYFPSFSYYYYFVLLCGWKKNPSVILVQSLYRLCWCWFHRFEIADIIRNRPGWFSLILL